MHSFLKKNSKVLKTINQTNYLKIILQMWLRKHDQADNISPNQGEKTKFYEINNL